VYSFVPYLTFSGSDPNAGDSSLAAMRAALAATSALRSNLLLGNYAPHEEVETQRTFTGEIGCK
jgi:hypothetical protein